MQENGERVENESEEEDSEEDSEDEEELTGEEGVAAPKEGVKITLAPQVFIIFFFCSSTSKNVISGLWHHSVILVLEVESVESVYIYLL